jgi:hypothetical protein
VSGLLDSGGITTEQDDVYDERMDLKAKTDKKKCGLGKDGNRDVNSGSNNERNSDGSSIRNAFKNDDKKRRYGETDNCKDKSQHKKNMDRSIIVVIGDGTHLMGPEPKR